MNISLNQPIRFYLNNTLNFRPLNSKSYTVLHPQNGDRIVKIDYVSHFPLRVGRYSFTSAEQLTAGQFGIGNESVPIQLAQCWLPGLAISDAKI